MNDYSNKPIKQTEQLTTVAGAVKNSAVHLQDNRPGSVMQKKQVEALSNKTVQNPIQKKPNNTGLPDQLKAGVENLSGYAMDDVKVHYNSAQPAQLNAHAYAQGTDIHIASGQEKHLPHEAWHVVQQKQGRVKPTVQMKGKVNVNDDKGLEKEADVMGEYAQVKAIQKISTSRKNPVNNSVLIQAVLKPMDQKALRKYLQGRLVEILYMLNASGLKVIISEGVAIKIRSVVNSITINAINSFEHLQPALDAVDSQLNTFIRAVFKSLKNGGAGDPKDPAFKQHQWEYLMPMMAHIQQAKVLGHAMLSHSSSLTYSTGNQAGAWLDDPDVALKIFQKIHQSTQGLLWFANLKQAKRQKSKKNNSFKTEDGLDLMTSVGRLSMMIADSDFLPSWDTRALPHNWTSDYFLDQRIDRPGTNAKDLKATKKNLSIARIGHHEANKRSHDFALEQAGKPGLNKDEALIAKHKLKIATENLDATKDPQKNDRTDFRYEMDVPTSDKHSAKVFNSGALRLDFSNARKILDKINPGATNEDLSYENIVAYLNHMKGNIMQQELRLVFQHMGAADVFLRELVFLLVGIEGSQNNMMMIHGPMVMDLASQGKINFNQGLFTGERKPTLESMPYFVYAADATQKGTDKGTAGPMERQSELLKTGKFNPKDIETETKRKAAEKAQKEKKEKLDELESIIRPEIIKLKEEINKKYQAIYEKDEELMGKVGAERGKAIGKKYGSQLKGEISDAERFVREKYLPMSMFLGMPVQPEYNPLPEDKKAMGYLTFKDVYMQKQFDLQKMFLKTFFPQVFSLDFGPGPLGQAAFISFVQKLMEHYAIYRFFGTGENVDHIHNQWGSNRGKFINPNSNLKTVKPITNQSPGASVEAPKTTNSSSGGKQTAPSVGMGSVAAPVVLLPPPHVYKYKVGNKVRVRYHLYYDVVGTVVENFDPKSPKTKILVNHCFNPNTSIDCTHPETSIVKDQEVAWYEVDVEPDIGV